MFLPDTNVVSELLRPSSDPFFETRVEDRPATDLYFSAIDGAELRYGVPSYRPAAVARRGPRRRPHQDAATRADLLAQPTARPRRSLDGGMNGTPPGDVPGDRRT